MLLTGLCSSPEIGGCLKALSLGPKLSDLYTDLTKEVETLGGVSEGGTQQ